MDLIIGTRLALGAPEEYNHSTEFNRLSTITLQLRNNNHLVFLLD